MRTIADSKPLVSHSSFKPQTVFAGVTTMQVAPTILRALGLDPRALDAVRAEGTPVLPEVEAQLAKITANQFLIFTGRRP